MVKFAVVQTGGKQYKVAAGDRIKIEKLETDEQEAISFDKVLLIADGDKISLGKPYVEGAIVEGKLLRQGRARKVIVFKYHSKARYRKKKGHRQPFTEVEITGIR